MSALSIQVPFPVFQGRDGQPLENGYVWIGEPNLNPQTNPVVAYYDEALTIVAAQPLRTLNGYISRAGTPAQIYVDGVNFSILVQDSKGTMVYNFPDGTGISPDACGVTYNPPFAGSVPYPVCEKLAQTVSVMDFGAVGDGVTDDTAAIQAAHNASRVVEYPEPSAFYNITGTITLQPGSELISPEQVEGNDTVSTIKYTGVAGAKMFACDAGNSVKGIVISGLVLDGNGSAAIGLSLNTYRSQIDSVTLKNFTDAAIDFPNSSVWAGENRIQNCMIYNCDIGIRGGNRSFDGFITDCIIYECDTACVDLASDGGWLITGNHFYGECVHYIRCARTESGRYLGNLFDAHKEYGIKLTTDRAYCFTVISQNTFSELRTGARYGIHLTMSVSAKVLISGNTFYASQDLPNYYAIFKAGAGTLFGKISENLLSNLTSSAISVDANTEYLQLTDGTLLTQATRVLLRDNIAIRSGFGTPTASDQTGSIYSAYNSSDATAKGPFFVRYSGAWKKVPVLDRWQTSGLAEPVSGEWTQGDIVWNAAPSAGGIPGWMCVTSGTPGTWKAMANLAV